MSAPTNPKETTVDLDRAIRAHLQTVREHIDGHDDDTDPLYTDAINLGGAVLALLDLRAPTLDEGDDPDMHEILTAGWETAHHMALSAIASALGVEETRRGNTVTPGGDHD